MGTGDKEREKRGKEMKLNHYNVGKRTNYRERREVMLALYVKP
jgi:hypothetical protein